MQRRSHDPFSMLRPKELLSHPLRLIILIVLLLGVGLRWGNLAEKVYWVDEVHTSTRIAGYTRSDVGEQLFDQGVIRAEELRQYQVPEGGSLQERRRQRPWSATWTALIQHPEHPPLYYLLGRLWLQGWLQVSNDWVLGLRSLAVLMSLAVFPALYGVCREIFQGVWGEHPHPEAVAWVAIALVAMAPLHILYAQEARQYSLFTVTAVAASAALLRAIRRDRPLDWVGYGVALVVGFYSHLLFGLVAIAHGLYVLLGHYVHRLGQIFFGTAALSAAVPKNIGFTQARSTIAGISQKILMRFSITFVVGLLAFVPWLVVLGRYLGQVERAVDATQRGFDLDYLINVWLRNLSRVFFSTDLGTANVLLLALVGYSLYRLCRDTPLRTWSFVLLLIIVPALPLMVADVVTGGISSARIRYLIPSYVGIQVAIAYFFTQTLTSSTLRFKRVWGGVFAVVLTGMVVASVLDAAKVATWAKSDKGAYYPAIASAINASDTPLVISDSSPTYILALGRLLKDDVALNLVTRPNAIDIPREFETIFVFDSSNRVQRVLKERLGYRLITVVEQNESFQLLKAE